MYINVREYRFNQKWSIQRNWQHRSHKTQDKQKKTQQNCAYTNTRTQAQATQTRHEPPTNDRRQRPTEHLPCGSRNGHHNMEPQNIKTHNRTTQKTKMMSSMDTTKKFRITILLSRSFNQINDWATNGSKKTCIAIISMIEYLFLKSGNSSLTHVTSWPFCTHFKLVLDCKGPNQR